jgi:hypothetical protein
MTKKNLSIDEMQKVLVSESARSIRDYRPGLKIVPNNKMDRGQYSYQLTAKYGDIYNNEDGFRPYFTPAEMLLLGVFEGKYLNDCLDEFPKEWFLDAIQCGKLSPKKPDISCNHFGIKSRMSLQEWKHKGWIPIIEGDPDNRGWFQWYCRYYLGRRIPDVDRKQMSRWRAFKRHYGQVSKNCPEIACRPKQRQALLQWSYDAFVTSSDKI